MESWENSGLVFACIQWKTFRFSKCIDVRCATFPVSREILHARWNHGCCQCRALINARWNTFWPVWTCKHRCSITLRNNGEKVLWAPASMALCFLFRCHLFDMVMMPDSNSVFIQVCVDEGLYELRCCVYNDIMENKRKIFVLINNWLCVHVTSDRPSSVCPRHCVVYDVNWSGGSTRTLKSWSCGQSLLRLPWQHLCGTRVVMQLMTLQYMLHQQWAGVGIRG